MTGAVAAETPAGHQPVVTATISATLEGSPLSIREIGAWACHDFEYPKMRCFKTPERLMAALETGPLRTQGASTASSSAGYIIAYDLAYYGGPNPKVLSSDQAWLVLIGWSDVTSSFKSFGATGRWWEHSPSGGVVNSYGATTWVPALSSVYNNKFSAFEIY